MSRTVFVHKWPDREDGEFAVDQKGNIWHRFSTLRGEDREWNEVAELYPSSLAGAEIVRLRGAVDAMSERLWPKKEKP